MPIFIAGCPYLLWNWAPGCLYLRKYWHRGGYFFVKFSIRDAYFWGRLFSLDIGTVSFTHSFLSTGLAEQIWQTRQSADQCFVVLRWCCRPFACRRDSYLQHRLVLARTSRTERKRELRRSGNKQIESAVATHSWRALLGIRSRVTKYWQAFVCRFSTVYLKPPMPMDTNLHACGREAKPVISPCQD